MKPLYIPNWYKITYRYVHSDELRYIEVKGPYELWGALSGLCAGPNIKNINVINVEIVK